LATRLPQSHQTGTQRLCDSFGLRVDLKLLVDVSQMERNGVRAYAQFRGGGLVVVAIDQQF
jgi:hypothetical protein